MSLTHQFFKSTDESKDEYLFDRNKIVTYLKKVVVKYDELCKKDPPGKAGIKRKANFINALDTLADANNQEKAATALIGICDFYHEHKKSGRLSNILENALMVVLDVKFSVNQDICKQPISGQFGWGLHISVYELLRHEAICDRVKEIKQQSLDSLKTKIIVEQQLVHDVANIVMSYLPTIKLS